MTVIERTHYFAHPGRAAEVLAMRRRACRVRLDEGLPPARSLPGRRAAMAPSRTCRGSARFPMRRAQRADLAARAASAAFEAVRAEMRTLIARFERQVLAASPLGLASGMRDTPIDGHPIRPREIRSPERPNRLTGLAASAARPRSVPLSDHQPRQRHSRRARKTSRGPAPPSLLMSWGIASFLPHRRGYGNSEGPGWREEVTAASRHGGIRCAARAAARCGERGCARGPRCRRGPAGDRCARISA